MTTKAAIKLSDQREEVFLFRYNDGYPIRWLTAPGTDWQTPAGVLTDLVTLRDWVHERRMFPSAQHAAAWLVRLGTRQQMDMEQWATEQLREARDIPAVEGPPQAGSPVQATPSTYLPCSAETAGGGADWSYHLDLAAGSIRLRKRREEEAVPAKKDDESQPPQSAAIIKDETTTGTGHSAAGRPGEGRKDEPAPNMK